MFVSNAKASHVARIELILNGVHNLNQDYVSDRLCQAIPDIISCRFMNVDTGDTSRVELLYDSRNLTRFELLSAMYNLGYSAEIDPNQTGSQSEAVVVQMRIEGMHCNSCVSNICAAIEDLPGAIDIKLKFEEKIATVIYDSHILSLAQIVTEIVKLGFKVAMADDQNRAGLYYRFS